MISNLTTARSSVVLIALATIISCCFAARLPYTGVNLSGGEWDSGPYWPTTQEIDFFASRGMNVIRLPFTWENLQKYALGDFDPTMWSTYTALTDYITKTKGLYVIIEPHNFGRYKNQIVGGEVSLNVFLDLWTRLANYYKTNNKVIFNLMNEPNSMSTVLWANDANSTVKAIRDTNATNLIMVPGNGWTGAWSWNDVGVDSLNQKSNAQAMLIVVDPIDNMFFEFHQYFDSDYGGENPVCQAPHIGSSTVSVATNWLKQHNKKGFLGELGGSDSTNCITAINDALAHLEANSDVWMGWAYWSGGPRTSGDYLSISPLGYPPIQNTQLDTLMNYIVNPPVAFVYPNISASSCNNSPDLIIFDDSLQNGFDDYGWAASRSFTSNQASSGTYAISFESAGSSEGLQLGSNGFSFKNYNAIQFDIKGATADVKYEIYLATENTTPGRSQALRGFTPSHTITTSYQTALVPFPVFHVDSSLTFTLIVWQSSFATQNTVYLDNIKLVCVDIQGGILSGTTPTPTAGNSPTSATPSGSNAPSGSTPVVSNTPADAGSNGPIKRVSQASSVVGSVVAFVSLAVTLLLL